MTKYIKVEWPEIQYFQSDDIDNAELEEHSYFAPEGLVWFIEERYYKKIMKQIKKNNVVLK